MGIKQLRGLLKEKTPPIRKYLETKRKWFLRLGLFVILLFIVYSIYALITTSIPFFYVSIIFKVITIIFGVIVLGWIYFSFRSLKKAEDKKTTTIKILIVFVIIWLAFQFSIIGGLQYEYSKISENYSNNYHAFLIKHPDDFLNASWDLTQKYYDSFFGTYGVQGSYLPDRSLAATHIPLINPFLDYYFDNMNGYQKLLIVQQKGNCGEFSQSIVFLLNDTTHFPTKLINFEGIDHMMPEIEINNQWWVVDKVFLTHEKPINSYNLSNYIGEDIRNNIAFIYSSNKENSLLKQHGFNETNFTITTIVDYPGNPLNGKPIKDATIEVFSINNSHDPLVSKGVTNENGQFSTVLNSDKGYWIFANYEPIPLFPKFVGLAPITKSAQNNLSVIVYLTNYG